MMNRKKNHRPRRTIRSDGPDPLDIHVGQKLRLARTLAGINQTELGHAIGVSFQAVQKYEQANNRISASRLFAAANALKCPVSFFFDGIDEGPATRGSFLGKELELIRALRRIANASTRDSILQLVNQIGRAPQDDDCTSRDDPIDLT
jgi:transcriptional regulator with XRE-family HTH domain